MFRNGCTPRLRHSVSVPRELVLRAHKARGLWVPRLQPLQVRTRQLVPVSLAEFNVIEPIERSFDLSVWLLPAFWKFLII